jgi:uncharacterized protein DUF2809
VEIPPDQSEVPVPRAAILAVLIALVPLGLSTKRYHGPGQAWVHANAGDIVYAAFWFFFLQFVRPPLQSGRAALAVFLYCCLIEFSQLLHPPWLEALRQTLPGRLVLGSDFDPMDIAYYAVGVAVAASLSLAIGAAAAKARNRRHTRPERSG